VGKVEVENNPDGSAFWTEPYLDSWGNGVLVSFAAPLHIGGELYGVVAVDVTLKFLEDFVKPSAGLPGDVLVVTENDVVLAEDMFITKDKKRVPTLAETVPVDLLYELPKETFQTSGLDEFGGYYLLKARIKFSPYYLFYHFPKSVLNEILLARMKSYLVLALSITIFLFLVYFVVVKRFVNPYQEVYKKNMVTLEDKQNLLRILIHDLSTPVMVALGCLDEMDQMEDDGDKNILQRELKRAVVAVETIVKHVRDFSAASDGKKKLKIQKVKLIDVFNEVSFLFRNRLEEKNIQLNLVCSEDLVIDADPVVLVNTIVSNLVSNAIKFSYEGATIALEGFRVREGVRISVADNGQGIPGELIGRLFSFSEKTTRSGTRGEEGTGFGMPLVRKYVELMGGQIEVRSISETLNLKEHGTIFSILFPISVMSGLLRRVDNCLGERSPRGP
jgi:signal transduction histidine kinase